MTDAQPLSGGTEDEELRALYRGYVGLLESSRDRIMEFGGDCDPVDRMEDGDPALIRARAALSRPSPEAVRAASQIIEVVLKQFRAAVLDGDRSILIAFSLQDLERAQALIRAAIPAQQGDAR